MDASVECVGVKIYSSPVGKEGTQAPLDCPKTLWRKAVKAAEGEAQSVP